MRREPHLTNAALMARRHAAVPRGVGQAHQIFIARGSNAELWDVEGKRYIDFAGGIAVLNTGHCHPEVIAAVKAQLDLYTHTCFQVLAYEPYVELAERLNCAGARRLRQEDPVPDHRRRSGRERGQDRARRTPDGSGVIAFAGGYHGRTMLTLGLTGKIAPYKAGFGPFPAEIFHAAFPNALHGVSIENALASIETIFKNDIEADRVAAFILEPVQGEGGFYIAPPKFVEAAARSCATGTASCSSPTRSRPAPAAPAPGSRASNGRGARPDRHGQVDGRRLSDLGRRSAAPT